MTRKIFTDTGALVPAGYGDSVARISDLAGLNGDARPALQSSSALRPVYGRGPLAGRRNLFRNSNELLSGWTTFGLSRVQDGPVNPQGSVSWRLTNFGDSRLQRFPDGFFQVGKVYTASAVCKTGTETSIRFQSRGSSNDFGDVTFDLKNEAVIAGNGSIVNLGDGWLRCIATFEFPDIDASTVNAMYGLKTISGEDDPFFFLSDFQVEEGSVATPYQDVKGPHGFNITEPVTGAASPSYLRFDLTDDKMTHTFPDGFTGDVMLFGRNGSWVEENVTISAGGTLDIGPNSVTGGIPGSLDACGDVVGWLPVSRTLSAEERQYMVDYFKERGAKGLLVPGPELVTNGDFSNGLAGWGFISGDWEVIDGRATVTGLSSGEHSMVKAQAMNAEDFYLFSVQSSVQLPRIRLGSRFDGNAPFRYKDGYNVGISKQVGTPQNRITPVFFNPEAGDWIDNVSVRELRPEEEW